MAERAVHLGAFFFRGGFPEEEREAIAALLRTRGWRVARIVIIDERREIFSYRSPNQVHVGIVMEEGAELPDQKRLQLVFQFLFQWIKWREQLKPPESESTP